MLLGRKECEEEERRAREDIERLRLAEAAQLQQEEKQRQVLQECVAISQLLLLLLAITTMAFGFHLAGLVIPPYGSMGGYLVYCV